jgi:hypothetical protein
MKRAVFSIRAAMVVLGVASLAWSVGCGSSSDSGSPGGGSSADASADGADGDDGTGGPIGPGQDAATDSAAASDGGDADVDTVDAISDVIGGGTLVVSCSFFVDGMSVCTEFTGLTSSLATQEQAACAKNAGSYAETSCATTGASGACTYTASGAGVPAGVVVKYVYYALTSDQISQAAKACVQSLHGVWTAG